MRVMSEKQSKSTRRIPVRQWADRTRGSLEDRAVFSRTTGGERVGPSKAPRIARDCETEPVGELCRDCLDVCLATARHCARKIESGDSRYLPLLHAAIECHDALSAYWDDLTGPANSLREIAVRCCASACSACGTACERCPPRDRLASRCQAVCVAVNKRLADSLDQHQQG